MAVDNGLYQISYRDSAGLPSSTKVNTEIPTGANMTDLIAARDAFVDVVESLIEGTIVSHNLTLHKVTGNNMPAGSNAQRSKKFVIYMRDNISGEPFNFTIPTAKDFDGVNLKRLSGNQVDITTAWWTQAAQNGGVISRIGAINAFARSPEASHDATLEEVWLMD
jgi:hypothetical protein